jgi:hypothetical protein
MAMSLPPTSAVVSPDATTSGTRSVPVRRGCGYRLVAGIYVEAEVEGVYLRGATGDAETFDRCLYDPPISVDLRRLGATDVGVHLVDSTAPDGRVVTHVLDVVGRSHYPDVAGFIAEARLHGVSRRIPSTIDFSRLTVRSRIILVHARAGIDNAAEYFAARPAVEWSCPKGLAEHLDPAHAPAMCASLFDEDLDGSVDERGRECVRTSGDTTYRGRVRPAGLEPVYRHAIFASFPASSIAVIRDPKGSAHEASLEKARRAALPVHVARF